MNRLSLQRLSLKQKLVFLSALSSGSALLLAVGVFMAYDFISFREGLVRTLSAQAAVVGYNSASSLLFQDSASAEQTLSALKARPDVKMAGIYDTEGRPFALWRRDQKDFRPLPPLPTNNEERYFFNENSLFLVRPVVFDGAVVGHVYIESGLQEAGSRLLRFSLLGALVLVLSLAAATLIFARIGDRLSRPILDLAGAARAVSERNDYAVRVPGGGADEVGRLVDTFNEMLSRIQAQENDLQRSHDELERRVLERTAELQTANKELESFSYSVSHDLRTPLRTIDGFSAALLEDLGDKLDESGRDNLNRVRKATRRMGELIDDMLTLSRLARQEMARGPVDLTAMGRAILDDLRRGEPGRKVDVVVAEDLKVEADSRLLRAVMENLLGNAWKFTAKKDPGRVELGSFLQEDGAHVFFVKDNGAGFNMTYAHKLFGAFQRLHDAAEFPGTGVGLATVARVIQRHGGRVWGEGRPDEGATFYFTLP